MTKGLTGLLLADMVEDREVRLDQPVGELVPGTALARSGDATLAELAAHRSGLPRLPVSAATIGRSLWSRLTAGNPYRGDAADALAAAADAGAGGGADPAYSNLGAATLGHALARDQGTSFGELLGARLVRPLGLTSTGVATTADQLPSGRAEGATASGRVTAPWLGESYAPAGVGVWSTAADLARVAQAILDGSAPGVEAVEPRARYADDDIRIGLFWITSMQEGVEVTWHNGRTGGFASMVAFDQEAGRAVVVLGNTDEPVDEQAIDFLLSLRGAAQ